MILALVFVASFERLPFEQATQRDELRVATFNIEFFPKNQRQVREAFREIRSLGVAAVGVQEITDPARFAREAKERLGDSWEFVYQLGKGGPKRKLHIGVVFDTRALELVHVRSRSDTRVDHRTQPTLEARFRQPRSGRVVTLLVVHFKAMSDGRETRAKQYRGLKRIVTDVRSREPNVIVVGDFNATELGDRQDLERLAQTSGMVWASEQLPCSSYWERENDCPTSRLDHVLTWSAPRSVTAHGGCADGCETSDRCPVYKEVVSDHCPVVIELP